MKSVVRASRPQEVARTAAVAVRGSSLAQVKPADREDGGPRYLA